MQPDRAGSRSTREAGYSPTYVGAVSIASAVIGPIIPPSFVMVIYAELAEVSVVRLFLSDVITGLLIGAALMVDIYSIAERHGPSALPRASWGE